MCPKLMDGLSCINTFTVRCLDTEQRNYFNILYSGIIQVIEDLCRPGPYQSDYLRHSACMSEVQPEYQQCSAEYQARLSQVQHQDRDQEVAVLCCSFQSYLACSQGVVNRTCGRETADFTAQFLDRMAAPLAPDDPGETVGAVLLVLKYALGDLFQSFPRMPLSSRATACNTRKMKI